MPNLPPPCPSPLSSAIRSGLLAGLLGSACCSLAMPAQAEAARQEQRLYQIPAGTLDQALTQFAASAGLLLSVDARLTAGKPSLGLQGHYAPAQALSKLLAGSGLSAYFSDDGRVLIEKSAHASDALELGATRVKGQAEDDGLKDYGVPRSVETRNLEQLERFRGRSNADLLAGIAGVQTSDGRNGGGIEVNIRGIQGQGRVPVKVDGSQQSLDVYRGYAGTAQRAYIDPDLISSVTVNKGPSLDAGASGAIGGSVEMQTLTVDDILKPGETTGWRLRGSLADNSSADVPSDYRVRPRTERNDLLHAHDWSRSLAFAHKDEAFDVVAAYAERRNNNYFAGKHGYSRYDTSVISGGALVDANTVARNYWPGEEVLNSSTHNKSFMLKGTLYRDNGLELGLGYRYLDSSFGEIMPSQIGRSGPSMTQPLGDFKKDIDRYDEAFWMSAAPEYYQQCSAIAAPVPDGDNMWDSTGCFVRETLDPVYDYSGANQMIQFKPGNMKLHTLTSEFKWRPEDDSLARYIDLNGHAWATFGRSIMYNNVGFTAPQRGQGYQDEQSEHYRQSLKSDLSNLKVGTDISNTSRLLTGSGDYALTYGASYQYESIDPSRKPWQDDLENNRIERNGYRHEYSLSTALEYKPVPQLTFTAGGRYSGYRIYDRNRQALYAAPAGAGPDEPWWNAEFAGFADNAELSGHGFAPAYSVSYAFTPNVMAYALYNQGMRMPSLFETTLGSWSAEPNYDLRPERMKTFEVGASFKGSNLLLDNDQAGFKLAYFHNTIDDMVTRNYRYNPKGRPGFNGELKIRNVDSFTTQGIELQSHYDSAWWFADASYVYNIKAETCDRAFAQALRDGGKSETPDCTTGGFQGSYTNTQNPPRYSVNLVLGAKAFEQKLASGIRMRYTSGPMYVLDKSWHVGTTTPQQHYLEARIYDFFADYQVSDELKVSFNVYNFTDQYYLDPMSQSMMPAPGRTSSLAASLQF